MARRYALVAAALACAAANPWARKNKKEAPLEEDKASGVADGAGEYKRLHDLLSTGDDEAIEKSFEGMGDMWENLMDSPEMAQMLADPELLKKSIRENPLINMIPGAQDQINAIMDSPAFSDPEQLAKAMRQGVDAMKAVGDEFGKHFGDQMKLAKEDPEKFSKQMADAMASFAKSSGAAGQDPAAALEAAKGLWGNAQNDPEYLAKLGQIPGMEHLSDPEKLKEHMATLEGMVGAGGEL